MPITAGIKTVSATNVYLKSFGGKFFSVIFQNSSRFLRLFFKVDNIFEFKFLGKNTRPKKKKWDKRYFV